MRSKRWVVCVAALLLSWPSSSRAQGSVWDNFPGDVIREFQRGGALDQVYSVSDRINPFYLRGDFDGDGRSDYAILVTAKKDHSKGIAIWLSSQKKVFVLGAGQPFQINGEAITNLDFLDVWQVYGKKTVEGAPEAGPPPKLIGEAILAGKAEAASGLIYWNGKNFLWYQQGDCRFEVPCATIPW
jgi:hypothetical protein